MPLPKCVRIDARDRASARALAGEGWREIGICDQWSNKFVGRVRDIVTGGKRDWLTALQINEFGFTGRLWRDPKIERYEAVKETVSFIKSVPDERFYQIDKKAFAIVSRRGELLDLDLIGVVERGRGHAQDLLLGIAHQLDTAWLKAGTYSDNHAARRLYMLLGLEIKWSDRVFHK